MMRVGLVAKGLLLKGDLDLELVLLCKDKPTSELLQKVADNLGVQLAVSARRGCGAAAFVPVPPGRAGAERCAAFQAITEDKYEIIQAVGDAAIVIKNTKEPPLTLTIHLTSPVVREEMEKQLAGGTARGRSEPHGSSVPFRFPPGGAPQGGPRWEPFSAGGGPHVGEF